LNKRDTSRARLSFLSTIIIMDSDKPTAALGLLALPTELLIQVLLAVDEPRAIHHTAKIFFAISEVCQLPLQAKR
jgi:hypothetical protein